MSDYKGTEFEQFIIYDDNNWYTRQEINDKYTNDSVYCYIRNNSKNEIEYQPKILMTYFSPLIKGATKFLQSFNEMEGIIIVGNNLAETQIFRKGIIMNGR